MRILTEIPINWEINKFMSNEKKRNCNLGNGKIKCMLLCLISKNMSP